MEHKRVDSGHTPRLRRGTGAMTCAPGSHSTIVDFTEGAFGYARSLGNCGNSGHTGILRVEPTRVRGGATPCSLVSLEGLVGFWVLPRHLLTPGDLAMTL
jgi:hypothetical protein